MHENTCRRVTFLVNLMFSRLNKLNGLIFRGDVYKGAYIRDVIGLHIWGAYILGAYIQEGVLTGFYGICTNNI